MGNWKYIEPTGPTLDIKAKGTFIGFPVIEDERTDAEIMQDEFDKLQEQYEYERDHPETISND